MIELFSVLYSFYFGTKVCYFIVISRNMVPFILKVFCYLLKFFIWKMFLLLYLYGYFRVFIMKFLWFV